jgi:hypothetical protein
MGVNETPNVCMALMQQSLNFVTSHDAGRANGFK